jgi:hypothetical protein
MTTTHRNCSHPTTKSARAKCRRGRGAAYNTTLAARRTAKDERLVLEPCSCNGPTLEGVCTLCDRPQAALLMNALGRVLVS